MADILAVTAMRAPESDKMLS